MFFNSIEKIRKLNSSAIILLAGIIIAIGLVSIIGWFTQSIGFIQVGQKFPVIQLNTAIILTIIGLAFVSLYFEKFIVTQIFGILIALFGLLVIFEYFLTKKIISDVFFTSTLGHQPIFPGRPAFITALSFFIAGLALLIYPHRQFNLWRLLIFTSFGFMVLCLGFFGTLATFTPIDTSFGYSKGYGIAPQTSLALLLVGIGLIFLAFQYALIKKYPLLDKLSYLIILFGISLTLLLCFGLINQQNRVVKDVTIRVAQAIEEQITFHANQMVRDTQRRFNRLKINHFQFNELFQQDSTNYVEDNKSVRAIGWINPDLKITEISPQNKYQRFMDNFLFLDTSIQKSFFDHLQDNKKFSVFFTRTPIDNNSILILIPFVENNEFKGALFNIVNASDFFALSNIPIIKHQFHTTISSNNLKLYQDDESTPEFKIDIEKNMSLFDTPLIISIIPKNTTNELLIDNYLIGFIFLVGSLSSFLLGALIYYWRENFLKLHEIRNIKEYLDLSLQSARLGTWSWDINSNQFYWDTYTSYLLGLPPNPFVGTLNDLLQHFKKEDQIQEKEKFSLAQSQQGIYQSEVKIIWPDYSTHTIAFRGSLSKGNKVEKDKMSGVCWDISSIRESHELLETEFEINNLIKDADNIEKIAPKILELLCKHLNWDIGAFWLLKEPKLECMAVWQMPHLSSSHFAPASKQLRLEKGVGFPGKVLDEKRPLWIEDLANESEQPHAAEAILDGLHGVFGFPIANDRGIIGVIELYRKKPISGSIKADFLNFVFTLGHSLAQFDQRNKDDKMRRELAAIVEFSRDAIFSHDLNNIIINWNQGAEDLFGYSANEVVGKVAEFLIPHDRLEEFKWLLSQAKKGKVIKDYETERINKNGEKFWVYMTVSPIKDKLGNVSQVCIITQNIDNLKQTQARLKENEEKFRAFVETTNEWVWAVNEKRKITYSNPTVQNILGYDPNQIIGMDMALLIHENDRDIFVRSFQDAVQRRKGWLSQTLRWIHKDSSFRWLEGNSEIVMTGNKWVTGFQGVDRDVTERKNLEKIKDEFLSMVNHELRTPLTSIRGALGLILGRFQNELSAKIHQLLDIALSNSERLIRIINDILDIEKMESGKLSMQLTPVNLTEVIKESLKANQAFAEKFQIKLTISHLPEQISIFGDSNRLMQVFDNLLSNAIKFSPPGKEVQISADINQQQVKVAIKDFGEGIPEKIQPMIFQKFVQADSSTSRKATGTGLGLVITKNIIERLGGKIYFESKEGEGSTFYFELPLGHESIISNGKNKPVSKPTLLLLIKNNELASIIEQQLEKGDFEIVKAESLLMAQNLVNQQIFCAIVLDMDSLTNDELGKLQTLCQTKVNPNLPILLTSNKTGKEKQSLISTAVPIIGWIENSDKNETLTSFVKDFKKLIVKNRPKIIYVEDDKELFQVIKNILDEEAIITSATSIKEAKEKLTQENFDLVLLDLKLPDGHGSELLPCINKETKQPIPVIIFTVNEPVEQAWIHAESIKEYLVKARTTNEELIDIIRSLLKHKVVINYESIK